MEGRKFVLSAGKRAQPAKKHSSGEKPRRIVLNLTPQEFETLGLVAAKKGVTHHDLVQSAMSAYLEWLISERGEG
jgi:hypothetical protein